MIGVLGFHSWWGLGIFVFTTVSRIALGLTQPPIQGVPGTLSLGVKQLVHEAHLHLVLRSKNEWHYTSTPQYASMAWCSVKAQGQLYLYFTLPYLVLYEEEFWKNLSPRRRNFNSWN
jgi:hypothetical protein